jgi:hypothetical protein
LAVFESMRLYSTRKAQRVRRLFWCVGQCFMV